MAKIGCLKPFRGTYDNIKDIVLEDGDIAFAIDTGAIYFGDGVNNVSNLAPFINTGNTDISGIGTGSITSAISTLNGNMTNQGLIRQYLTQALPTPDSGNYYIPVYSFIPRNLTITINQAYTFDSSGAPSDCKNDIQVGSRLYHDNYFIPLYTTNASLVGKTIALVLLVS